MAGGADPDYVELELPREAMTLEYLTVAACEELGVEADQVTKSTSKYLIIDASEVDQFIVAMIVAFTL